MENDYTIHRYVNILMDKWFKRILGAEANKETLMAILRELIPERDIADLTYNRKTEPDKGDSFAGKLSYALTHMSILKDRPTALIEQVFGLLFAACEIDSLSEQEQEEGD